MNKTQKNSIGFSLSSDRLSVIILLIPALIFCTIFIFILRYFLRYIKRIHKFADMNRCLFFLLIQIVFSLTLFSQVNSVLSTGNWYEITTQQNGIYQLTYSDIQALGVSSTNIQVSDIKLYGNGGGMLPELNSDFRYSASSL